MIRAEAALSESELISRRKFIKTSSGLLVLAGTAAACGGGSATSSDTEGTIHVDVTGLLGASTGGSVSARRTNNTGDTYSRDLTSVIAAVATVHITNVPPGDYNVTYTPPGGFRTTATTVNPRPVSVNAGQTVSVIFATERIPAAAGVVFAANWGTATGTSDAAKRDTGSTTPWHGVRGTSSIVETRASAGLDAAWPTPNAFVIRVPAGQNSLGFAWSQPYVNLGLPTNGTNRFFRLYTAMLWADSHGHGNTAFGSSVPGSGNVEHGIESADVTGSGGGDGFNPMWLCNGNGVWMMAWRDINTGQRFVCDTILLSKFATYRVEWHIAYGSTSYQVRLRVFNGANTEVLNDSNLLSTAGSLTNATFAYTASEHQEFRVGCNGPTSNYPDSGTQPNDPFRAHGAVAISESNWVGPYANGI